MTVRVLLLVTTVGTGLLAGVWFAFSSFVAAGIARGPEREAIVAFQGINRVAVTPVFMLAFLGTAALSLALVVWGGVSWSDARAKLAVGAGALYLIGSFGVTMAANVPLNDRLDRVDATGPDAARAWADYYGPWMLWNHTRTLTAIAALALLVVALTRD